MSKEKALPAHPLVIEAFEILKSRAQTVAFAESCTGGLLSAIFTRLPGVSSVYPGSVIAYSYAAKEALLGVPGPLLRTLGAVSAPVARKMAEGVRTSLQSTWGISITGIAGPDGGTPQKPVGTVFFAITGPGVDRVAQRQFKGTRREVQFASARFALRMLLRALGAELGSGQSPGERIKKAGKKR